MACGGWEGSVDSSQLEARLRAGLEADRRYAAENAAKLRAIHSAPTYEEFRQLVLGKILCFSVRTDDMEIIMEIIRHLMSVLHSS